MSICRRTDSGGIYIYEMATTPPMFHCQICSINQHGDWLGTSRWAVGWHLLAHKWREGRRVRIMDALLSVWWYRS